MRQRHLHAIMSFAREDRGPRRRTSALRAIALHGRAMRAAVSALTLAGACGCASLPDRAAIDAPRSLAVASSPDARLAGTARDALARANHSSAFKLLPIGPVTFDTLLELAAQAQQTIDVQTFVLQGDTSGAIVLRALRDASRRGVRIRLLVDDLNTDSAEKLLSDIAAFDRVEVRLINPFTRLRGSPGAKIASSLDEVQRVNHRMHNKLFIADNDLAVIGGRNIGDPYYLRSTTGPNFIDLDVLAAGAVVSQMSASFDAYWNSEFAWPIDAIVAPRSDRSGRRASFDRAVASVTLPAAEPGIPERLRQYASAPEELRTVMLRMTGADAEVVADPVDKLSGTRVGAREGTVRAFVAKAGLAAKDEIVIVSPYYIPGRIGIESLRKNRRDGVRLRVLTNSLAATDEPIVHAGYLKYRREMIELGMEIDELSPSLASEERRMGRFGDSRATLHMKAIVFDRKAVFIGSLNLDGRSEQYNTEIGVMIRSPALARELMSLADWESESYRVTIGPDGALRWTNRRHGRETVLDHEPEASSGQQVRSKLFAWLIPDDWL